MLAALTTTARFLGTEKQPDGAAIQRALEHGKVVALTGHVEQVNRSTDEWSLLTNHGVQNGEIAPGGPA